MHFLGPLFSWLSIMGSDEKSRYIVKLGYAMCVGHFSAGRTIEKGL